MANIPTKKPNGNNRVVCFTLLTFALLLSLSFIPTFELSFLESRLKSINIFSQLTDTTLGKGRLIPNIALMDSVSDSSEDVLKLTDSDTSTAVVDTLKCLPDSKYHLYDYSGEGVLSRRLAQQLQQAEQRKGVLRVAFLGDSFIEGDILTGDVRSLLQREFGGRGVGYVPIASATSGYRRQLTHIHKGWMPHSIVDVQKKDLKYHLFTFSGNYFEATEGASVSVSLGSKRDTLSSTQLSKLLYISTGKTTITPIVNGATQSSFETVPSSVMQSFDLRGAIRSVKYTFHNTEGFTAYGVYLNDTTGVCVDNYSVRGSMGTRLFPNQGCIHGEFNRLVPYQIIVFQYGLNVTEPNRTDYSGYRKRMVETIGRLQKEHPQAICILMSVGDRAHKPEDQFETMPGIHAMVAAQRAIAKESGILFWDTFAAMGGQNSMVAFAEHNPPLAAKDYTHINHAGGSVIAKTFVKALLSLTQKSTTHSNE